MDNITIIVTFDYVISNIYMLEMFVPRDLLHKYISTNGYLTSTYNIKCACILYRFIYYGFSSVFKLLKN